MSETTQLKEDKHLIQLTDKNTFKLERLKYILDQQKFLNEYSHKYLTIYQSMITAIVGAGMAVFMSWKRLSISLIVARTTIRALECILILTGAFMFLVVFTTIASWWDYRKEETELLNEVVESNFRSPPSIKGIWRWFESWLLIFVVVTVLCIIVFGEVWIVPLMK